MAKNAGNCWWDALACRLHYALPMNHLSIARRSAALAFLAALVVPVLASAGGEPTKREAERVDLKTTRDLATLARSLPAADGHIVLVDASGTTRILASDGRSYVAGYVVPVNASFALCQRGRAGLNDCLTMPAPSAAGYECGAGPSGDTGCSCSGVFDCIQLIRDGACEDDLSCDSNGCVCSF